MGQRIAIVGAGIVGAMVARQLARAGHDVTLIDAAMSPGRGVSGRSFGWMTQLAGYRPPSPEAFAVRAEGRRAYDVLNEQMDRKLFAAGDGAMVWRADPAETEALVAERKALGADVVLAGPETIARIAPHLASPPPVAAYSASDIFLRPALAAERLAKDASDHGALLAFGHSVLGIWMKDDRAAGVWLTDTTIPADHVVIAAGGTSTGLLPEGIERPDVMLSPSALITLTADGPAPALAMSGPDLEIRKDRRDGHFLVAASVSQTEKTDRDALAEKQRATAQRLFPGLRNWRIASAGIASRPIPRNDTNMLAGPVAGVPNLHLAVGHPGVTLAPVIAARIAASLGG
ncbi:hypothetical protein ATO6_16200 [Oceanicola sp. 22II-s10i]|uniref:NAD(P)/FAD-dependent oxidoreductase n=1 Tax=Oceanicola sp. 22II-s10i TaxID=1317116 RepID=UPI000B526F0E|nr:FAD-binding oxidoreductase [Oceanicola sp. 22II-s10i]OWU83948.1 hypothetical protein ATO6_16200 [Oceanicola sp. 22II-s10i]